MSHDSVYERPVFDQPEKPSIRFLKAHGDTAVFEFDRDILVDNEPYFEVSTEQDFETNTQRVAITLTVKPRNNYSQDRRPQINVFEGRVPNPS